MVDEFKQEQFLKIYPSKDCCPHVVEFSPWSAPPASLMVIIGHGFAPRRELNAVTVGGHKAIVITAEWHRLVVICDFKVNDGPVQVKTPHGEAKGPRNFRVLDWPPPSPQVDGPPHSFEGVGDGTWTNLKAQFTNARNKPQLLPSPGIQDLAVPRSGTANVLVVCGYPSDTPPANIAAAKAQIVSKCAAMTKYYTQASYGDLTVSVDVRGYFEMANKFSRYYQAHVAGGPVGYPNFPEGVLPQIRAECAGYAEGDGANLATYDVLMCVIYMKDFVRAWGGEQISTFNFSQSEIRNEQAAVSVNIILKKSLGTIVLGDKADSSGTKEDINWGRYAHEFGHNIVPAPAVLKEDIYASDTGSAADVSGAPFDLMGYHDQHPLFSGYNIDGLGWYKDDLPRNLRNVVPLTWSRTPFSQEFNIVAHGLIQNTDPSMCHLVRIQVSAGLEYYVEVRQTPGGTDQVFDDNLRTPATLDGGILITRSISGTLNNNEEIRLITLLQTSTTTLKTGEVAVDPLRTILITVLDDSVQARPRVCKVKIEWAQPVTGTPGGTFDLRIDPWGPGYTTPDIWIDRPPFYPSEPYDRHDASGNPIDGGDAPLVSDVNQINARIHNDGSQDANDIITTFYVNTPPGIGDDGNWTPLKTITIPTITKNDNVVVKVDWNPPVGQHTCLQVAMVPQTGEVSVGNNRAQENVFDFKPAQHSIAEPIELPVVVRNPLKRRTLVFITVDGVPEGFYVYFPRQYLYLEALGQERLELLVIPRREVKDLETKIANVRVHGYLPWSYAEEQPINGLPIGSTMRLIGGIQARVAPKIGSQITLQPNPKKGGDNTITVVGNVTPPTPKQKVRVDMTLEDGSRISRSAVTSINGGFTATFSISAPSEVGGIPIRDDVGIVTVVLAFQAHIINAEVLAPSDSNIVHFTTRVGSKPPEGPE